jgi:hypothetical protein
VALRTNQDANGQTVGEGNSIAVDFNGDENLREEVMQVDSLSCFTAVMHDSQK